MNVLVLDKKGERAETNARAFSICNVDTFLYSPGEGRYRLSDDGKEKADLPGEFSLLLLHDTDRTRWGKLSRRKACLIVRYTGGDERRESEGEHWIRQRSITGKRDALSPKEAQQILSWANEFLQGEDAELPPIMQEPANVDHLSALSILCQGYLAVHAEAYDEKEGWEPEEISDALEQMKWTEELMSSGMTSRVEEVTKPDWWRVFDDEDGILDEAKQEWGDEADGWSTVKDLLIRVMEGRNEEEREDTDEPEPLKTEKDRGLVADAYCKLAERLGGDPCQ